MRSKMPARPAAANARGIEHLHINNERPEVAHELSGMAKEGDCFNPVVSKAQNAAMHAAAEGHSTLGIPASVGKKFVAAGPKGGSYSKLPARKR